MAKLKLTSSQQIAKNMTESQKRHYRKALLFEDEASKAMDLVKTTSPKASALITKANIERQKAGLIKGALKL